MALQSKSRIKELHCVTLLAMSTMIARQVASCIAQSRTVFYFWQRLQRLFSQLQCVTYLCGFLLGLGWQCGAKWLHLQFNMQFIITIMATCMICIARFNSPWNAMLRLFFLILQGRLHKKWQHVTVKLHCRWCRTAAALRMFVFCKL